MSDGARKPEAPEASRGKGDAHSPVILTRKRIVFGLILIALAFRLYPLLTSTYIWDEEREWIAVAERISFCPGSLYLPIREGQHPSLPAYFIKAGSALLGRNPLGYRFFSLAAGMLTLLVLWGLAARWAGPAAAMWTLALLAPNEYHIGISVFAVEKSFQHLFAALSLYAFYRYFAGENTKFLYLSAVTAGLAFLCNERSVLLLAAYGVALFWSRGWGWLRRKEIYLALAIFVLTISPDIYANLRWSGSRFGANYSDHLSRIGGAGLNRHYFLFFGRDAFAFVYNLLGRNLHDQAEEYPAMNPLFGALLLAAAASSLWRFRRQDAAGKLFLSLFGVVLVFFSVLRPAATRPGLDPVVWFWVDLTLPAAALLGAPALSVLTGWRRKALLAAVGLAVLYAAFSVWGRRLGLPSVAAAAVPEVLWPADGCMKEVRVFFHVCAVCKPATDVKLVELLLNGDRGHAEIEGANLGTDDRTFRLRAASADGKSRVYTASYRVRDYFGTERTVRAKIFAPTRFDRPWPPRFWTQTPDR
jgi:4-amino-4-deoxy-L-arabinose transferase-like glycosyltransferase